MKSTATALPGVAVVETDTFRDHRGAFSRYYCQRDSEDLIGERRIVQINYSQTSLRGAVRGLHFQYPPHAELKMVRCLKGRVWDVALDLRRGSPTFLHWHAEELSERNARMMVIPEGCAHGFQALEEDSELLYLHTEFYAPEAEGGVSCTDPRLAIPWPLPIADLSRRDGGHPPLGPDFLGIAL
jgi:dTDP-4-dehydrorhamnose 3,5-epimerase